MASIAETFRGPGLAWLARLPLARDQPLIGLSAAVLISVLALVVRLAVDQLLPPGFPFVTFFPAVIATAFVFGLRPGILAAVLGFILSSWFFIPPVHTLSLSGGRAMAMALYTFVVVIDIALLQLMQHAYREVAATREESRKLADHREILFRELQHRVGNNLQMIASLLALQKRKLDDPGVRAALDEASRRIGLIGRIQRQLYDPNGAQLGLSGFLVQLCGDLVSSFGRDGIVCRVTGGEGIALSSDAAIPLALIVSEAVSNAIEHGFAGRDHGHIAVVIVRAGEQVRITVSDDGRGLPAAFDLAATRSLGLRLAQTLASGHGGTFTLEPGRPGAVATIMVAAQD